MHFHTGIPWRKIVSARGQTLLLIKLLYYSLSWFPLLRQPSSQIASMGHKYAGLGLVSVEPSSSPSSSSPRYGHRTIIIHLNLFITTTILYLILTILLCRHSYTVLSKQLRLVLLVCTFLQHYYQLQLTSHASSELTSLFAFLSDLHLCVFYSDGKYSSLMNRLLSIRLVCADDDLPAAAAQRSKAKPPWNIVSWIMTLRLVGSALLAASNVKASAAESAVSVTHEFKRVGRTRVTSHHDPPSATATATGSDLVSPWTCPVCATPAHECHLACSPCGHVLCWSCLHASVQQGVRGAAAELATRYCVCPLCRHVFEARRIRMVYNFIPP